MVRPKKHLGQHFLHDRNIARKIANSLSDNPIPVLEIGPGTGVLTSFLMGKSFPLTTIEVDQESVAYLHETYPQLEVIAADFLRWNPKEHFEGDFRIIGNFPYNISSQILFRVLEYRHCIPEIAGMFQKEVALRIAEKPGSKQYGILSVLCQAFYDITYLFTVSEQVFTPPPAVKSGVISMLRKEEFTLPCDEALFFTVVKTAFNQRRKTLRNALKGLHMVLTKEVEGLLQKRAEQLSVEEFILLTLHVQR
ncbi:MAG: 16S rRNA (adenine(1518)-N(6)/adenine(1519)-N(6))-dimethyltransferase [Bacteroidetes bacterium]|nr:MAG: 16S rRNA (adenine(1518)-N(6)/adenine(1519)-N(6))-dimethyltransferase [Bacteroidota bacterium]PIE87733.1 MAG: 16S rRNA (adenine(1518)-N(6)/adenine(1519)-N(6))-dimethyltransferase [Bacteroidota bacterium]